MFEICLGGIIAIRHFDHLVQGWVDSHKAGQTLPEKKKSVGTRAGKLSVSEN